MSYDLNIFVLGQEKPSIFPFSSSITYDLDTPKYDTWQFIYELKGTWYYLGREEDGLYTAMPFCDSNFEISENELPIPHWIKSEEVSYHLTPLKIREEYVKEFKKIVEFFINESPHKMIMLFARYQGGNQEIIQGVISLGEFYELLNSGAILFNICYVIKE